MRERQRPRNRRTRPNQPLQPSHSAVTPRAGDRVAPAGGRLNGGVRHPWEGEIGRRISLAVVLILGMACSAPRHSQPNVATSVPEVKPAPTVPTPVPALPTPGRGVERIGPGITPPRLINDIRPHVTEALRALKLAPRPFLYAIVVDQAGCVRDLTPVRVPAPTPPYDVLDRSFREAIMQWRYQPAEKAGRPVAVQVIVEVNVEVQ